MMVSRSALLLALGAGLALSGCAKDARPAPATATATPADEVSAIARMLDAGETKAAGKRIKAGLKRDPMNPELLMLQQAITGDAQAALGPRSFPYTVRPGDTMGRIAGRFLGNPLKAYQLARYNGIDRPVDLAAGQVIRIPGEAPRAAEPRARRPDPAPTPARPARPRGEVAAPKAALAPAARARPTANPAAARQTRAAGLAALNQGQVGRAIGLLRRAAQQDPGNPAITRDLARAERIGSTVKARR